MPAPPAQKKSRPQTPPPAAPPVQKIYSRLGPDLRPSSMAKYTAILDAASKLFITKGFGQTSMDTVAEAASVSKRTVYGHFETKPALFAAVIETMCERVWPPFHDEPATRDAPIADVLNDLGQRFLRIIYSPAQLELIRTVISDAPQFPELGAMMFDGPVMRSETAVAAYLRQLADEGRLVLPSQDLAASQLIGMLKTNMQLRLLMKPKTKVTDKEIAEIVAKSVDLFLHGALPR